MKPTKPAAATRKEAQAVSPAANRESPPEHPDLPTTHPEEGLSPPGLESTPPMMETEEGPILFARGHAEHPLGLPEEQEKSQSSWVVTFADLNNLLLCFFILLFASSRLDLEKFRLIAQSMSSALGGGKGAVIYIPVPAEEAPKMVPHEETDMTGRLRRTLSHANQLRATLGNEIKQRQLDVEVADQLITIQILQNGSFPTGSATLDPNFLPTARKIRDALVDVPGDITVAGHTDNQPVGGGSFRSNWELSGARAFSVMHELLKDNVLPGDRFVLKGYGDTQPRFPNTSQANREKNRRVEIVIDQRGVKDSLDILPGH
ncbi:MAG: flagellar motor protein MotB [Thermodesulfobacteriota bacterium]